MNGFYRLGTRNNSAMEQRKTRRTFAPPGRWDTCPYLIRGLYRLADRAHEALSLEMQNDLLRSLFRRQIGRIDHDLRVFWFFVRVRNSGELFQNSGPSLGVQAFSIALLAHFDGGRYVHQDEPAQRFDQAAHMLSGRVVGSDRRANGDAAVLGDFRSHITDAPDVDIAMLFGE